MSHSWEQTLAECVREEFGSPTGDTIEPNFEQAARAFADHLQHHVKLAQQTADALMLAMHYALGGDVGGGVTDAKRVTTQLLIRIAHDIRAIEQLARSGLAYQAITLSASTFEYGVMVASISDDNKRAADWLEHSKLKSNIDNVWDRCRLALDNLEAGNPGLKERLGDLYQGMYEPLCAFKHGNPNVQKHLGAARQDEGIRFELFPVADRRALIAAGWAIMGAIRSGWLALVSYATHHLPCGKGSVPYEDLREIINGLNRSFNVIQQITAEIERSPG